MSATTEITFEIDEEALATLDRMAADRGLTRNEFVVQIVRRRAERETELRQFVQAGIDAADRGDMIDQDEMERWFQARYEERAAAE